MEYILSAVWIFLELLNFITFSDAYLYRRKGKKQTVIAVVLAWIVMYVYSRLFLDELVKLALTICFVIGLSLYLFKASFWHHILYAVLAYSFVAIIDVAVVYGISWVLGISYSELIWRPLLYSIIGTVAKLLSLLIAYVLHLRRKSASHPKIRNQWLLLTLLFPAISVFMIVIVFNGYSNRPDLSVDAFIFSCILSVANIAILYLISAMEKSTEKEKELVLINQQMEIHTKNIVALEKSYRAQRRATHEFNHQLQTIQNLLLDNATEAAQEYVTQLQGSHTLRISNVNSHHPIIDAVLNQKYQEANEQSIEIQLQINNLSGVTLKPDALVVLLSNLFDNAIEACMQIPSDRIIHCSILANDDLFISIRNPSMPVTITNGSIETTKEPKEDHGYGLVSIQHILNMLNAEYTFEYDSGWFYFVAEIPHATM